MKSHWTDKHIAFCRECGVWIAYDEAGLPYSVHIDRKEAVESLESYAAFLEMGRNINEEISTNT